MNFKKPQHKARKLARCKRIAIVGIASVASFLAMVAQATAGEPSPDINMLLNLDLFGATPSSSSDDTTTSESLLDQIRTLNAMGYLGDGATTFGSETLPAQQNDSTGMTGQGSEAEDGIPQP